MIVVVAGGAAVYGLMQLEYIPIKLVLVIVISVGVAVFAALRSLFIRRRDVDPGVSSTSRRSRASRRPRRRRRPDRHRGRGLGVSDPGNGGRGDGAAGSLALAVRMSVHGMALSLAQGGAASWYNPAWLFLLGFNRMFHGSRKGLRDFRRSSPTVGRLAYGSDAFEEGLRHVVSRSVRFPDLADANVNEAIHGGGVLSNVYASQPREPRDEAGLDRKIREALDRRARCSR